MPGFALRGEFCDRRGTKSSIPGSSENPRRAPSPAGCIPDRSAQLGKTGRGLHHLSHKDTTASPYSSVFSIPRIRARRANPGWKGSGVHPWAAQAAPLLFCRRPQAGRRGRQVGPSCCSHCLKGSGGRGAGEGARWVAEVRGEWSSAGANTRVAQGECWTPRRTAGDWGRRVPYLGELRKSCARRPAVHPAGAARRTPRLRGARSLRVHSPRPRRAPRGWRTLVVRGAHTLQAPSGRLARLWPRRTSVGTPTAADAGLARRRQPRLRPASPAANSARVPAFARGEKKKTPDAARALVCRKGQNCETEGRVLASINSKALDKHELTRKTF